MTQQSPGTYDNDFFYNNVYGHALALLRDHRPADAAGKIHLDLGCGYGRIAEPLTAELGITYVGADADDTGLASLRSRGFETHSIWLGGDEATYQALRQIADGRRIGSITMLDTLEHLPDGDAVLQAIRRIAIEHSAFVVISVPNVAHRDIGLKLALGRWDYTKTGLLDHTHTRLFSADVLDRVLRHAGLYTIANNDVRMAESDQHFPPTHVALARSTYLNSYLMELRQRSDPNGDVNQFVRICIPGAPTAEQPYLSPKGDTPPPFLSIVIRTQGKRPHTLDEALTALAGQSDTDFEVLVLGHKLPLERLKSVERTIDDCPEWLRVKTRLLQVDDGDRSRPLNVGFADAKGDYIAILDDDDLPFGHWVETFHGLAAQMPGRMLRAVSVRQEVTNVSINGRLGLRATGTPEKIYPSEFDFFAHLRVNHTPPVSAAFPRSVFHDLGMHFDETLTTTEDWDYIVRVAAIVGTASSPEVTSIYRWWHKAESSRTVHAQEEWDRNHLRILQKMDDLLILFPRGTVGRIRYLLDHHDRLEHNDRADVESRIDRDAKLQEIVAVLNSTSWRITQPLRTLSRLRGRPDTDYSNFWACDTVTLTHMAAALRRSNSWRITGPLRRLRGG